ncbi:MAG: 50S ribosomal protein L15 [Planctomycetia bacterium]|nr:50S ribosomal protein L15 [Planctomycetia bacterium]
MNLHTVNTGIVKNKKITRLGRGKGSGKGRTAGRGTKGYGSRSGSSMNLSFEGGQMPLFRRVPKRGFNNAGALEVACINVCDIDAMFSDGETVNVESLKAKGILKYRYDVLKVLGDGELTKKVKIQAHRFSKTAEEKIKAAGAEMEVLPGKKPVVKGVKKAKAEA